MNERIGAPIAGHSLGTFQLRLMDRWVMIFAVGLILITFTIFEMSGLAGGDFWFLMFLLSALVFLPVIIGVTQGHMDLFEPIFVTCAAYFLYFVWAPTNDFLKGNYNVFGIDILAGISRGTLHAVVGVAAMLVGYYVRFGSSGAANRPQYRSTFKASAEQPLDLRRESAALKYALVIILTAIGSLGLTFKLTGWNWARLLSFGQIGDEVTRVWLIEQNPFLNYLYLTVEFFLPSFLILLVFRRKFTPRSRFFLTLAFIAVFIIYTTLGFRYRVLLLMMAPAVYHYMLRRKRPGVVGIGVATLATIVMVGLIGGTRGATRTGSDISREDIEVSQSGSKFTHDLRIYPAYYRMLDVFPVDAEYLWGSSYLYVFISPIPRALWADKPESPAWSVLRTILGNRAVEQGLSYPNLGEMYVNFGFVGEMVLMFVFGFLLRKAWTFVNRNAHDPWALILYVMFLPFLVQIVSRGYFVQIAQEIFFIFGPALLGRYLFGEKARQRVTSRVVVTAPPRQLGYSAELPSR